MSEMTETGTDYRRLTLEVVTPTMIGSGDKMTKIEYLVDEEIGKIYVLNQGNWHRFLMTRDDLFDAYKKSVGEKTPDLFLNELKNIIGQPMNSVRMRLKPQRIEDCIILREISTGQKPTVNVKHSSGNKSANSKVGKKVSFNELATHVATPEGKVYIPGSSIKGAVRTALLWSVLKRCPDAAEKVATALLTKERKGEGGKTIRIKPSDAASKLESLIWDEILKQGDIQDSKYVMSGISISDAMPVGNPETVVLKKLDYSARESKFGKALGAAEGSVKELPLYRECIVPGTTFSFSMEVDATKTAVLGIRTVDDVLKVLQGFFEFIQSQMPNDFKRTQVDIGAGVKQGGMYLGAGTGFLTKTLVMSLVAASGRAKGEGVEFIRRLLSETKPANHKHGSIPTLISPRTLKLTEYKGKKQEFGIVRVYE